MKYMLMMNTKSGPYQIYSWSKDAIQAHMDHMIQINRELESAGEVVVNEALIGPDEALKISADDQGLPVTDGVFPESKEFLAGFWIVDVSSTERAHQIAAKVSMAPGPDGKPLRMPVEVREVMADGCDASG